MTDFEAHRGPAAGAAGARRADHDRRLRDRPLVARVPQALPLDALKIAEAVHRPRWIRAVGRTRAGDRWTSGATFGLDGRGRSGGDRGPSGRRLRAVGLHTRGQGYLFARPPEAPRRCSPPCEPFDGVGGLVPRRLVLAPARGAGPRGQARSRHFPRLSDRGGFRQVPPPTPIASSVAAFATGRRPAARRQTGTPYQSASFAPPIPAWVMNTSACSSTSSWGIVRALVTVSGSVSGSTLPVAITTPVVGGELR